MQEDETQNMKEFGPEIGIGPSTHNDFGDFAPRTQEYNGNPQPTPENQEQKRLSEWVNRVKTSITEGTGMAFVHDRTNFDIDESGNVLERRNDGYQNRLIRGEGFDEKAADRVRNLAGYLESNPRYEKNRLDSDEVGLPRENDRSNNVLYISIARDTDIPPVLRKDVPGALGKSIVELRYKQPRADESHRTAEKRIIMVVPHEVAEDLQSIVEQGVDPNTLRDMTADIFVPKSDAGWYDVNLIDRSLSRPDQPVVGVRADKPELHETFLQVTRPGGKDRQIFAEKKLIRPGENVIQESEPAAARVVSTEPLPEKGNNREGDDKTGVVEQPENQTRRDQEITGAGVDNTEEAVIEQAETEVSQETNPDEDPWHEWGTDWGDAVVTQQPENVQQSHARAYVDIARATLRDPQHGQNFEYWVGDEDKNIPSKLALLAEGGMTHEEISELLRVSTTGGTEAPLNAPENAPRVEVEPEPIPQAPEQREGEFPMAFAEVQRELKMGRVLRAEEMQRRRVFEREQRDGTRNPNEVYIPGMTLQELDTLVQREEELNRYLETMENTARERGYLDDITAQAADIDLELREFFSMAGTLSADQERRRKELVVNMINKWKLRPGSREMPDEMDGLRQAVFARERDHFFDRLNAYTEGVDGQNIVIDNKIERLDYQEQLRAVRVLLNRVESLDRPINQQSLAVKDQIEYLRLEIQEHVAYPNRESKIDIRVLREARARINLHEFYVTWRNFDLGSEEAKKDITNKLLNLGSPEDIPDGDDFAVLLKGRIDPINGDPNPYEGVQFMEAIPAGDMANRLQEAGSIGTFVEGSHGGMRLVKWNWNERAEKSTDNRLLKDKLREGLRGETETSYRLASRSLKVLGVIGTLDLPVLSGNSIKKGPSSPLGGYIYFQAGRYAALEKRLDPTGTSLDDPGPILSMPIAVGFGSDAIRGATYKDANGETKHLVNQDIWDNIERARARGAKPSVLKAMTLDATRIDPYNPRRSQEADQFIDFKNVAYEQLPPNFLENYYKKDVTMRLTVRTWLLTSTWKVDDLLDVDKMDFRRSAFNIVDPSRDLQIRQAWAVGVISEAIWALKGSETKNTLLHPANWNKFKMLMTSGDNAILTPEQFALVEKYCEDEAKIKPDVLRRQFMAEFTRGVIPTSQ